MKDTDNVEPLVGDIFPEVISNTLVLVGVAAILLWLNPVLAILTLVPVPLLVLILWLIGQRVYAAFEKELEKARRPHRHRPGQPLGDKGDPDLRPRDAASGNASRTSPPPTPRTKSAPAAWTARSSP